MKTFFSILLLFFGCIALSQNPTYYVKQTQVSYDLKTYEPIPSDPIFSRVSMKSDGIELSISGGKYTFLGYDSIDKVDIPSGGYRYEAMLKGGMEIVLFFTPQPFAYSEPKLLMIIVAIPGLDSNAPNLITFYRLVFHDDLILD